MKTPHARVPRVAIVNDHPLVVAGLAAVLAGFPDRIQVVELDAATPVYTEVDIILIDAFARAETHPSMSISEHLKHHNAKIVLFSWITDPRSIEDAIAQGAVAYLPKSLNADRLVAALEAVHDGEHLVALALPGQTTSADACEADWPGREEGLSQRESEAIALLSQGLSNHEIADALYLGENTVKTHLRIAYRKMSVTRRSQAVLWAIEHDFTRTPTRTILNH